jgi:hypothetical protein
MTNYEAALSEYEKFAFTDGLFTANIGRWRVAS